MLDQDKQDTDPTSLTTASILREIANLDRILTTRLEAMDKAVIKLSDDNSRVPTILDKTIGQLQALINERFNGVNIKFEGVEKQFFEREVRIDKLQLASQRAIEEALRAQKEAAASENQSLVKAIGKAEQITGEQLVQQHSTLVAVDKTLTDKINALTDRINRSEGTGAGREKISAPLWAAASAIITAIMISAIMAFVNNRAPDDNRAVRRLEAIENALIRQESENKIVKGNE